MVAGEKRAPVHKGVEPDRIQWIIPNDAWFFNRASIQPGMFVRNFLDYFRCIAAQVSGLVDNQDAF